MAEISIIVPVHNAAPFLRNCLDSIASQTFSDFECIMVDDGSADNSGTICDDYAEKDARFIAVHQENGGVSRARNNGISHATGQYIVFCDSDDFVHPQWCEMLYRAIKQHPEACVVCQVQKIAVEEKPLVSLYAVDTPPVEEVSYFQLYQRGLSSFVYIKIFKSSLLKQHKLQFPEGVAISEDLRFTAAYIPLCSKILVVPYVLYYYVQHAGSAMHSHHDELLEWNLAAFRARVELIGSDNLPDFCDVSLSGFIQDFQWTFKHKKTLYQKFKYNATMLRSEPFQYCVSHCAGKLHPPIVLKILKAKNYYVFWAFQKMVNLKQKLCRK